MTSVHVDGVWLWPASSTSATTTTASASASGAVVKLARRLILGFLEPRGGADSRRVVRRLGRHVDEQIGHGLLEPRRDCGVDAWSFVFV